MTPAQALDLVREIRGLERLEAAITQTLMDPAAAPEWRYALTALDWQLRYCRYVASVADATVIAAADDVLQAEKQVRTDTQLAIAAHPTELTPERASSTIARIH